MADGVIIDADFRAAVAQLDNIGKRQVPFAAKNALNKLAAKVIEAEQDEMKSVFHNPTSWTLDSLFVRQYATKTNLVVVVDFKDGDTDDRSARKYLQYQINGGGRRTKAIETKLIKSGLMPADHHIFPASADLLDMHGNIPLSVFKDIEQGLRNKTYFVLFKKHGRLIPGVYRRLDKGREMWFVSRTDEKYKKRVQPLIYFVSKAQYKKRMRYRGVAKVAIRQNEQIIFAEELAHALATAR